MPAEEMSFVCGRESISWESASPTSRGIQRFNWGLDRALSLFQAGYDYSSIDHPVNLVREIWKAKGVENHSTLMKNLWAFRSRKCGNPRDKIFAIQGICKDLRVGDIQVDYSSSVAHVYAHAAKHILLRDRNFQLLSACQAEGSNVGCPSWVPDWSIDANF